jgi:hypothetical protein
MRRALICGLGLAGCTDPDLLGGTDPHLRLGPDDGWYDAYHPVDELEHRMAALATEAPEMARLVTLGASVEGRSVLALELGAGVGELPTLLVVAGQHAREWVGPASALYFAEWLLFEADPGWLEERSVVVVPLLNPDGYRFTWTTDRMWRKNRRDNGDGTFGVDLNRNWPVAWGGAGSSGLPRDSGFRGVAPLSEPEASALHAYAASRPDIGLVVDLHAHGQVVLFPYGFDAAAASAEDPLAPMGEAVAEAMEAVGGTDYRSGSFHDALYPASGTLIDWAWSERAAHSLLIELPDRGEFGFLLPEERIVPVAQEGVEGLLATAAFPVAPRHLLEADPLVAGDSAGLSVQRLEPGASVTLAWGEALGTTEVGARVVEVGGAAPAARWVADLDGMASGVGGVPSHLGGRWLSLQAVTEEGLSNALIRQVE